MNLPKILRDVATELRTDADITDSNEPFDSFTYRLIADVLIRIADRVEAAP